VTSHLRIKICGITNAEDARQAAALGADAIGLNFHPLSPRYVKPAAVEEILRELPPFVEGVGVFVRETLEEACAIAGPFGQIRTIQRHGDEHEPTDIFPFRLIEAFRIGEDPNDMRELEIYLAIARSSLKRPDAVLLDGRAPGQYGGTGKSAPWKDVADFWHYAAQFHDVPLILAGGLTPDNVAEAVRIVRPYAVDVASGVESSPGRKDVEKMKRFIDNARSAAG
jgi:phosphoribosylanthranilate isomerase